MRPHPIALIAGLLLTGLAACADDSGAGDICEMHTVAEMPVLNDHRSPIIKASINGTPVAFEVDTGARDSILFEDEAAMLGLPISANPVRHVEGIGGWVAAHAVTIHSLSIGQSSIGNVDLYTVPDFSTESVDGLPVVGLFGGDFLVNYDVEFDLPSHLINLFQEHHCSDHLRPWPTDAFYRLPFDLQGDTAIALSIAVNGRHVPMILDSGAGGTFLDADSGRGLGAVRATMAQDRSVTAVGIDGNKVVTHVHRFDTLDIGPEHFAPAFLAVGDIGDSGVLGADFFRSRKVWVSYPHQVFYVQRVLFPTRREGSPTLGTDAPEPARH